MVAAVNSSWTSFVLHRRRAVAVVWLLLAVGGAWGASTLADHLSQSFDAPDKPAFKATSDLVHRFGSGGRIAPIAVVATGPGEAATQALSDLSGVVPGSRSLAGDRSLVSRDGRTRTLLIFPPPGRTAPDENPEALAAVRRAADARRSRGVQLQVTGVQALTAADDGDGGGAGLLIETLVGALGALVVLVVVFGTPLALVPLVMAAVSILTTFLVLRGLAAVFEMSMVVQFLVGLIGLGVSIDYSLLLVVRWREERDRGADSTEAVRRAMATAGHAILISGTTVAIGLLAMVAVPVPFIRSIGVGGLLIPLISVAATLSLLPGLLASVGPRLDRRAEGRTRDAGAGWTRWSRLVTRHPWPAVLAGAAIVGVLAFAATGLRTGQPSIDALSPSGEARSGLQSLERSGLGAGTLTPIEATVPQDRLAAGTRALQAVPGIRAVLAPEQHGWRRGDVAAVAIIPSLDTATGAGQKTLDAVRDLDGRDGLRIGGVAAQERDLTEAINGGFPIMLALVVALTLALLTRALRSVVLPIKAVLLNVLSVGASFGVVVLVWQNGHGSDLIGDVPATGAITSWVPLAIFAFLYGLSMDYEVFILDRMREEYDHTASTREAVVRGLGRTGRLVTSAALILFLAFVALAASPGTEIKILATGLAAGILLDATVVRALLVPALVTLLGRAAWWSPFDHETRERDAAGSPFPAPTGGEAAL